MNMYDPILYDLTLNFTACGTVCVEQTHQIWRW